MYRCTERSDTSNFQLILLLRYQVFLIALSTNRVFATMILKFYTFFVCDMRP